MANPGVVVGGVDVRYAATYGNPYLRGNGPLCKHIIKTLATDLKHKGKVFDHSNSIVNIYHIRENLSPLLAIMAAFARWGERSREVIR